MSTPVKPDITPYLEAIENAVYGEEVRGSIHDAIEAVNDYADEFYTDAQEQAQAAANSASDASGYATTASNKAGEASASATAAGNAETAAKNAKTDAVDAKNLANTYAGNAATSAAQAAASAQAAAAAGPILVDTVGWMCKNRVPLTLESLKSLNTLGTWADNVYTRNDVDFTVNTNSEGYVTSIVMNGTASGFASLTLLDDTIANLSEILPQGNYIVNGCPDGGAMLSGYSMRFKVDTETYYITDSDDMTVAVSGSSSYQVTWSLACTSGTSVSSKTFKPMIRKAAIADNTFEAYHKSVEDWYWENNPNAGAKNLYNFEASDFNNNAGGTNSVSDGTVTITCTTTNNSGSFLQRNTLRSKFASLANVPCIFSFEYKSSVACDGAVGLQGASVATMPTEWTRMELSISNPANIDHIIFYNRDTTKTPVISAKNFMLRDARDTDSTYHPPSMTNAELTDDVIALINQLGGKILTSADDMDDKRPTGIYPFSTAPAHSPEGMTYGTLINVIGADGNEQQYVMKGGAGVIYMRSLTAVSPRTFSSWYKFTGTVVS